MALRLSHLAVVVEVGRFLAELLDVIMPPAPEDLIVVDRDQEQSTFRRLTKEDTQNWMDEFGLGDLWEKNLFGGTP